MQEPWFLGNERHGQDADVAEDHNFGIRAGDAGFDVTLDLEVRPEHLGLNAYSAPTG